jgi:hypothetical protein
MYHGTRVPWYHGTMVLYYHGTRYYVNSRVLVRTLVSEAVELQPRAAPAEVAAAGAPVVPGLWSTQLRLARPLGRGDRWRWCSCLVLVLVLVLVLALRCRRPRPSDSRKPRTSWTWPPNPTTARRQAELQRCEDELAAARSSR